MFFGRFASVGLLGLVLSFSGCLNESSSKVEQTKITTDYSLHYDATDGTIIGEAQFTAPKQSKDGAWTDTAYIELDNSSYVYFDQALMVETKDLYDQITYRKVQSGAPASTVLGPHTFRYVQNTGEVFVNSLAPMGNPNVAFPSSTVSKTGFALKWALQDAINGDSLRLVINTYDHYPGYSVTEQKDFPITATDGEMKVTSADLKLWDSKQTYFFQLCRVRTASAQQLPSAGGKLTLISCSKRQELGLDY